MRDTRRSLFGTFLTPALGAASSSGHGRDYFPS